jgi:hypothetical protein
MEWIKYSLYNLPPQGLKILCFTKGDVFVAQTINYKGKRYWIPIPFTDSILSYSHIEAPDYWAYVELPGDYTGLMQMSIGQNELMTIDEFEKAYPEQHAKFAEMLIDSVGKKMEKNMEHEREINKFLKTDTGKSIKRNLSNAAELIKACDLMEKYPEEKIKNIFSYIFKSMLYDMDKEE